MERKLQKPPESMLCSEGWKPSSSGLHFQFFSMSLRKICYLNEQHSEDQTSVGLIDIPITSAKPVIFHGSPRWDQKLRSLKSDQLTIPPDPYCQIKLSVSGSSISLSSLVLPKAIVICHYSNPIKADTKDRRREKVTETRRMLLFYS